MTILIVDFPNNLSIQLRRTPNRLLRVGNQLIVCLSGLKEWNPIPEKAKGTILVQLDNLEYVSSSTLVS
jgi:hypothetical protein